jgi:co-chaperonin GroES (HSP10)
MLPLIPLLEEVLVLLPPAAEQITAGGVIIPEAVGQQKNGGRGMTEQGTVIVTGRGRVTRKGALVPAPVRSGDEVLIRRHMGTELHVGKDQTDPKGRPVRFVIVAPKDILGVIE